MSVTINFVANCAVCGTQHETKTLTRVGNMLVCHGCGFQVRKFWDSRNEILRLATCGYQGWDDRQDALDGIANLTAEQADKG